MSAQMSDGPGWRFTSFKHSPEPGHEMSDEGACHTPANTSARITSDSNPDADARINKLFQPGIFSLFFYIFASKLQTYVTFITVKYPETKSHSAKAFVEPTHFLAYFLTFDMTRVRMFLMMDG